MSVGLLGAIIGLGVMLWLVDGQANDGVVSRNLVLVDQQIGGMDRDELAAVVDVVADRYAAADIEIEAPDGGFTANAAELGLSVQQVATVESALTYGERGFVLGRFWRWATGFIVSRHVPVTLDVDEAAVRSLVFERDPLRDAPIEPGIRLEGGRIVAVEGSAGRGIDPAEVVKVLRSGVTQRFPIVLSVGRTEIQPRFAIEDAERLAEEAEQLALDELPVTVGESSATVPSQTLRGWLRAEPTDGGLRLGINADVAMEQIAALVPDAGQPPVDAGAVVTGGGIVITPSQFGTVCCAPEASAAIEAAIRDRNPGDTPVELPLKSVAPSRDEAAVRAMGIVEIVGSFTTNHAAGEPRVDNIHRMADIVRGAIVPSGATFSLNGHVGERTIEKGFFEAPVIDGEQNFSTDVGGGVSQFSTTLFNAAFFAGLEIPIYGMHGIYISRYPYGREATLDFPSLDLKIHNSTPYGILVWPSYSATSITVTLYSTHTVDGAQTGQTTEEVPTNKVKPTTTTIPSTTTVPGEDPDGDPGEDPDDTTPSTGAPPKDEPAEPEYFVCTRVITERTRTWDDGRTEVDKFFALYAPEEGVLCR